MTEKEKLSWEILGHAEFELELALRDVEFDLTILGILALLSSICKWIAIIKGAVYLANPSIILYIILTVVMIVPIRCLITDFRSYLAHRYIADMARYKFEQIKKEEAEKESKTKIKKVYKPQSKEFRKSSEYNCNCGTASYSFDMLYNKGDSATSHINVKIR